MELHHVSAHPGKRRHSQHRLNACHPGPCPTACPWQQCGGRQRQGRGRCGRSIVSLPTVLPATAFFFFSSLPSSSFLSHAMSQKCKSSCPLSSSCLSVLSRHGNVGILQGIKCCGSRHAFGAKAATQVGICTPAAMHVEAQKSSSMESIMPSSLSQHGTKMQLGENANSSKTHANGELSAKSAALVWGGRGHRDEEEYHTNGHGRC